MYFTILYWRTFFGTAGLHKCCFFRLNEKLVYNKSAVIIFFCNGIRKENRYLSK